MKMNIDKMSLKIRATLLLLKTKLNFVLEDTVFDKLEEFTIEKNKIIIKSFKILKR